MIDASLDIPRRLNDPPRMFWWDIDVALLVLGAALAGMVAGFFVSGCAVGLLLASAYGRAKAGKHPAFALHLLYWHLPAFMTGLKRTPPSFLRELTGCSSTGCAPTSPARGARAPCSCCCSPARCWPT